MTSSFATRLFGYVTLIACFVVGSVVVRFTTSSDVIVHLDRSYLDSTKGLKFAPVISEEIAVPEIAFEEIKLPRPQHAKTIAKSISTVKAAPKFETVKVTKTELPFYEAVNLTKVEFDGELLTNHLALFKEVKAEEMVAQAPVVDAVQTKLAQAEKKEGKVSAEDKDLDAMFFEYPQTEVEKKEEPKTEAAAVADKVETLPESEDQFFDYSQQNASQSQITASNLKQIQDEERAAPSPAKAEEESIDQLLAFDYSAAQKDITSGATPKVTWVDTKKAKYPKKTTPVVRDPKVTTQSSPKAMNTPMEQNESNALMAAVSKKTTPGFFSKTTIQLTSTNLKSPSVEAGFDVRFQDDINEIFQDYGTGSVTVEANLARERMVRPVTVLKRGFTPTNNELIVEAGEATLSIPVIDEQTFNQLNYKYGSKAAVGAVLVELDDQTEDVTIDVPYGEVLTLDGDLRQTDKKDYRYKLFVGVRAGNVLLSAKLGNREVSSRILHVHENEVTFDANLYEEVNGVRLSLQEEELLMNGTSPLITAADRVRVFATEKVSKKLNDHTYSLDFGNGFLGSRRYVEVNHLEEPVFVGFRENKEIAVPSESFMTQVIRSIAGQKLTHHCVVQVNLSKVVDNVQVGTESVDQSLSTSVQMLDSNGKFYDSASDKTRKIIIAGESSAPENISKDAKINVKINYADGSVDYLGSYCSPNTYLVEQL